MNTIPHNLKFENCEKEIRHFFKGIVVLKETHDLYINNEKYGITLCYLIDNSDKNVIGIEEYNFKDKEKNTNFTENSLEISLMLPGGRQKVELPDYYKKQFKLPILLIDIAAVKEGYEQLNNIYYFYCNNKAFQVYHYKLTIAGKFIVVVPMEIKELNVHTRKVITKSFNREVFGETVTIYCQKLTEKSKTIWFKPKGLLLNMHYLYPIYLYAVTLYNETNLSQRDVCKCVQEKFNLKSFNASTLCRYLKMLHCEIKVKVENNTKEEVLEDIKQHKNNLKNKSNDVKKLITKERYFQTLKKKFLNLKKNFCNKIEDIYPYFLQYVKKEIYGNKYFMTLGIFKHYPFKSERENFGN